MEKKSLARGIMMFDILNSILTKILIRIFGGVKFIIRLFVERVVVWKDIEAQGGISSIR